MARGWESKSIESQIASAESDRLRAHQQRLTPAKVEKRHQEESLTLSRTRILRQLETTRNPRYRAMLESALADLDARLAALRQS